MARLKTQYNDEIAPKLMERFGYSSAMQIPKLEKVTLNMGLGEAKTDSKVLEAAMEQLREQTIFPEIDYDAIDAVRGLDVVITTSAPTDAECYALLEAFGFPFIKDHNPYITATTEA